MSEIKNGRPDLGGAEHSKCNHMMTLGSKHRCWTAWTGDVAYIKR